MPRAIPATLRGLMRHPIVIALVVAVAAGIPLAALAGAGAAPTPSAASQAAAPSPLAGLDRSFRALLPKAGCADVRAAVGTAKRQRTAALRGARTAPAKALARKRAAMRRAIAAMRRAAKRCAEAAPPGGGVVTTPPAAPDPAPTPPPSPPPPQVITLHVAGGTTFAYTETSASATAGAMRIVLDNASSLRHFVAVRTAPGQPALGESPLSAVGGPTTLDITLPAGSYQIFCRNNGHDALGMTIPFTVTG